jgi:peroxiredoxin
MLGRAHARIGLLLSLGGLLGLGMPADAPRCALDASAELSRARLVAPTGRAYGLAELRGPKGLVLAFTGIDCPLGNLYMPRLAELDRRFRPRGVAVVGVNSNAHETAAQAAEHAQAHGARFPVLKDPDNRLADLLAVERTCAVVLLDDHGAVRYRGAIDDQYARSAHRDRPTRPYLAEAVAAVLEKRDPPSELTAVIGCPIDRVDPSAPAGRPKFRPSARRATAAPVPLARSVTYSADVAPILAAKCQPCHRPGQVGRFSLRTYEQAKRWAASIREVVDDGRMPPWHADPRFGRFENDRSLTAHQRATLLAWVEQGTPSGPTIATPPIRATVDDWAIGEPDLVIAMPEEYHVHAEGTLPYQHFRVPSVFTEDRWVQALEARPGNRAVVHHIVVFADDHTREPDEQARHTRTHLVSFAPGDLPAIYPPGTAKLIPAGADIVFEVHYTPIGAPKTDRSSLGLIFARSSVTRRAYTKSISQKNLTLPPGEPNVEVRSTYTFPRPVQLLSLMPHMHLRGKDFRYTAVWPDGRSAILLAVPVYDFAWQSIYRLAEPIALPAGARIDCLAHFDNSAGNPANPDPTRTVTWGEQTWDEMMIGFVDYAEDLAPRPLARR